MDQSLSGLTSLSQSPLPFIPPPCECQKKPSYVLAALVHAREEDCDIP